ncbi:hypothetical protein ACLKA6_015927 [Drosophila palustris]
MSDEDCDVSTHPPVISAAAPEPSQAKLPPKPRPITIPGVTDIIAVEDSLNSAVSAAPISLGGQQHSKRVVRQYIQSAIVQHGLSFADAAKYREATCSAKQQEAPISRETYLMASQLCLGFWNARSILPNANELKLFLNKHKVDIMLISETHLHAGLYFSVDGYACYRANHPSGRPKGGSAVLVRQNLIHYHLFPVCTPSVQLAAVMLETSLGEALVAAAYLPPRLHWNQQDFQLGQRFIIGGDFNAKHRLWGNYRADTRGLALHDALAGCSAQVLATGIPTFFPFNRLNVPSCLDFFVYKGMPDNLLLIREEYDLSSDHLPLLASISLSNGGYRILPPGANISKFRQILDASICLNTTLSSTDDVDNAVQILVDKVRLYRRIANKERSEGSKFALWKLTRLYKRQAAPKFTVLSSSDDEMVTPGNITVTGSDLLKEASRIKDFREEMTRLSSFLREVDTVLELSGRTQNKAICIQRYVVTKIHGEALNVIRPLGGNSTWEAIKTELIRNFGVKESYHTLHRAISIRNTM